MTQTLKEIAKTLNEIEQSLKEIEQTFIDFDRKKSLLQKEFFRYTIITLD